MAIFNEPPDAAGVRINWQLVILACGLSLTLALAGATGMLTPAGTQPPPSAPRSVVRPIDPPRVDRSVRAPVLTFVLMESQEDAAALRLTIDAYEAANNDVDGAHEWTEIFVLETEADQDAFWSMLQRTSGDLEAAGTELRVVDLRE